MRARLTSSHLVGRVRELAELELACRESAAGRPAVVLISGESGVGKTRLIAELMQRLAAAPEPPMVLRGEAVEHGETELPYSALLGAVRPLVRARDPALERLSSGGRAQLAALLPALDDGTGRRAADDGSGQARMFEALLELIYGLSERRPVVLCLEDIHWADRSTRAFIAHLARTLRDERIMLLLSYRSDELHRRHPLRPLVSELERLELTRPVDLLPLDSAELTEVLTDILGDRPDSGLVGRLLARTEGNPLFTEELLAAGLDGRGAAPQSLRDAFMLRIERLSATAQQAVRAIAIGRELDERLIAGLTGVEPAALSAALREALTEQILRSGEGGFSFRHELLREALYDDLLPGERTDLHLALAQLLDAADSPTEECALERSAAIARHYQAAGDQPAALRATVEAAVAAERAQAYGEAAELAERVLQLWSRVVPAGGRLTRPDNSTVDHVDVLFFAGRAHMVGGDRARAEVLLIGALAEVDPETDRRRHAGVLARLARARWALARGPEALATAQEALAMLDSAAPERPGLLAWLARTQFLRGRFREAIEGGRCALEAATETGDELVEGEVLNTLGMAEMAFGAVEEGSEMLRRAQTIARKRGDMDSLSYASANLADLLLLRGRTSEALRTALDGLSEVPTGLGRARDWMHLMVSEIALEAGDLSLARTHLEAIQHGAVGVDLIFRHLRQADLALVAGDEESAALALADAAPLVAESSQPQWIGLLGSMHGELHRRRRQLPEARAAVATALDRLEICTDDVMRIARVSAIGARVEADIAQRGRDLREPAAVRDAVRRARIHAQRLAAAAQDGGPVEAAWSLTGAAELIRARGRHDPRPWLKAAEAWDEIERPYHAAGTRWRAAEAHVESGDRAAAAGIAGPALDSARALGAGWMIAELSALCDRARLDLGSADGAAVNGTAAGGTEAESAADPFGLTARERQVLALVAEGATNRQIGASLFMAEKTASVHVSRILAKLGVQSRTQAAAVAHRLHLS